jgi:hypothetical protein
MKTVCIHCKRVVRVDQGAPSDPTAYVTCPACKNKRLLSITQADRAASARNPRNPVRLLCWIVEHFHDDLAPFPGSMEGTTQIWYCNACASTFKAAPPKWEQPTIKTFGHEPTCKYVAIMRLVEE